MADFDNNFEGANPTEEDPAAEFLAREQDELAGLEDHNFGDSSAPQAGDGLDAFGGQASEPAAQEDDDGDIPQESYDDEFSTDMLGGGFDMMGGDIPPPSGDGLQGFGSSEPSGGLLDMDAAPSEDSPAPANDMLGGGFDMMGGGDIPSGGDAPSGGLLDTGSVAPSNEQMDNPSVDDSAPSTNGPSDAYAAISQVDQRRAEPEKIKLWREEQKARLEKKDAEEEKKKSEWQEVAKKELEDWYKHHAEQLEKAKENNRAAEEAFIKERDESIPGAQWEKICRLCEFNPKNMKSTKDVTRMRSMLLQLKQTPLVR